MFRPSENFYAGWRAQTQRAHFFRDGQFPAERLLQSVWQHQRLDRDGLKTADGKKVRVLHPGFASVEGGPDFRDAVIRIDGEAAISGDIEIDVQAGGWRAHGHDRNPHFKNVILHVVWDEVRPDATGPMVVSLKQALDAPLAELGLSLDGSSLRLLPEHYRGKCSEPLRGLAPAKRDELLRAAAQVRLENKAAQMRARAKVVGWEQVLWENLFRALGYKHNDWPMQNLAEMRPRWSVGARSAFEFQARLLGTSGLLPTDSARLRSASFGAAKGANSATYLRALWDMWWRERDGFSDLVLPRSVWRFHGLRPANHPQRRLALASHWLADKKFVLKLEKWGADPGTASTAASLRRNLARDPSRAMVGSLHEILQVERDEFWSWHWTFTSARLKKPQPLLGDARLTGLAINVVLPWLWARSNARPRGGDDAFRAEIERRYFSWPAAEDNAVLKLARQRLLGTSGAGGFDKAAAQQGLIQIVRDFCEHSNAVCESCPFPDSVRNWK